MREDQEFVEGQPLKTALGEIDARFAKLPPEVLEQGVFRFARIPPPDAGILVRELWGRHLAPHALDPAPASTVDPEELKRVIRESAAFRRAAESGEDSANFDPESADALSYERLIRIQKGKWYQVPKGTKPAEGDGNQD